MLMKSTLMIPFKTPVVEICIFFYICLWILNGKKKLKLMNELMRLAQCLKTETKDGKKK